MTAETTGHVMWSPDPVKQKLALLREPIEDTNHYFSAERVAVEVVLPSTRRRDLYDLVDGRYELVADSADELVLSAPFPIRLPIRDITP